MQDGFNIDGLIEALAKRVAEHVRAELAQDGGARIKARLLTVEQAAMYLGRTEEAMQHLIASGKIQTVRFDRRVFLDIRDLDRLIEDYKTSGIR
jgi:excisionase family DNA binding protein